MSVPASPGPQVPYYPPPAPPPRHRKWPWVVGVLASIPAFAAPTTAEPVLPEPTAKDYSVDLAVQSKQCFGSAGCNVVVEPKLNALGASTLLWECDITYSISGDESGELIETAYAQGGTSYRVDRTSMSTKNGKVVPKAAVTADSCRKP
ncbi:hypothetical protein [Amycolatopsis sp. DG1A-15b]|uniref:hypothetical protein n=1 Tax=Amycolatopsis sp. DG1A-15b TaxID=3052846 RepID=UPI00255C0987|nr:hypothetical protein [Amycolatopsis sp. DG1A-15b]WIX89398.1 hypothetical protein QRY02_02800 [Amycolatopsis sp. DG1A-15b]